MDITNNQAHMASKDMRDAFFDEIYELGKKDKNVIFITDDMDAFGLRRFKQDFPDQFINIGVAEQNMIDVAAGLASCGKKVYAYGICSYVTMRCFEQIKFSVCSMNLPVAIVGVGTGFSFSFDGPTHHGTQDVGIMRALPEMTIYNPSDAFSAMASAKLSYINGSPSYVRLDKGVFPPVYTDENECREGYKTVRPLGEVNVVSTGFMTSRVLAAIDGLGEKASRIGLIDLYRIKPANQEMIDKLFSVSKKIVSIEEHSLVGGIGSLLSEALADAGKSITLKRLAVQDKQFLSYGSREWFLKQNNLDAESISNELLC